ncbi:beta-ketoacyl-ACP synthase III [Clostridium cellulovorans]|uniref:Beta-ketoacyl-[acyl-carrier-protein] synthase III n=1 Tax=Clostridium cellulovorans (strain ATCC 35296 / DSM 3052 / OCM 3 / 743B) TaxID=573061 RepID=D9SME9_CLOC7|nr:beta-ketoacyl-ACP synthase III [Clostridium cellulovorans]ADL53805.1 3-oxoacyl-(acyl-carrier-protein) synthase III [Clostridium cellulovorans 743B]
MITSEIIGTGSYVPEKIVSNDDLSKIMDTNDEWIQSRSGISERRVSQGEDTSDLSVKAAIKAMEAANVVATDIDLIIVATVTPDMYTPSTACIVQKKIEAYNATAFDVSAACSGFLYGVSIANSMIKTGQHKTVLVIGAEVLSKAINWEDRATAVLFGDGAGAVIMKASENRGVKGIYTMSEGDKGENLEIGAKEVKNPFLDEKVDNSKYNYIAMNGREVFKFATKAMVTAVEKILLETKEDLCNIKCIIPHQANYRIIQYVSKKMDIPIEHFYINLDKYANTSAATIPIALDEAVRVGRIKKGDKIILVGFGGGLTYGAALIEW